MRSLALPGVPVLLFAALILGSSGVAGQPQPPPETGALLYVKYCSSCHGPDGRGRTPLGVLFRTPPADLTRIAARRGGWFPQILVQEFIDGRFDAHGSREMPVWGYTLDEDELILITEYLSTLQTESLTRVR